MQFKRQLQNQKQRDEIKNFIESEKVTNSDITPNTMKHNESKQEEVFIEIPHIGEFNVPAHKIAFLII
jgi:hypothetical protein